MKLKHSLRTTLFFLVIGLSFSGCTSERPESDLEISTQEVVDDFLEALLASDMDKLEALLHDDMTYTWLVGDMPLSKTEGKEAYLELFKNSPELPDGYGLSIEVLSSSVIGNTVLQERIDHFNTEEVQLTWHISGFFLVIDGKIKSWGDYEWQD